MEGRRKVAAESGLLALILAAGLILVSPEVLLLALPIAVHLILGLLLTGACRAPIPQLQARRRLSSHRIYEGESIAVELVVENPGGGLDLVLIDDTNAFAEHGVEGLTSRAGRLPKGGSLLLSYIARPQRGFYPLERVEIRARDLLGFASWEDSLACPTPLWVLPRYERSVRLDLLPRRTLPMPGTAPSRQGGVGVQFLATRPYIPGDDLRRLNWKALARRDQPVINLYEEERAAEVIVVLDGRERVYQDLGGQELFEHAVRACAALCDAAIRGGHRTGLLLYGKRLEWVFPSCGRAHRERLLQGLAKAALGSSEVFSELGALPSRLFPSGSSVIIVSPLVPGDEQALGLLRARGYDVLVLMPDPRSLSQEIGPKSGELSPEALALRLMALERGILLRALTAAGVRVTVWDASRPLAPLVRAAWGRRR